MQELQQHVETLAAELGVRVIYDAPEPRGSWARYDARANEYTSIHITPVEGLTEYYIALHELGHVATSDLSPGTPLRLALQAKQVRLMFGDRSTDPLQLESEAEASLWAFDHALTPADETTLGFFRRATASYSDYCTDLDRCPRYRELLARL